MLTSPPQCRVLTAGLVRVEFRDFFLGDELNSLYYSIVSLGLLVCTYNHGWTPDVGSICSTNSTWATPILAALPAGWRLGQSLRRYLDSDGLLIHMLNAGKYSASIAQFFFYYSWCVAQRRFGADLSLMICDTGVSTGRTLRGARVFGSSSLSSTRPIPLHGVGLAARKRSRTPN